jgi:hypothetical protein
MDSDAYKLDGYEFTVASTEMTVRSVGFRHAIALLVCLREHRFALLEKRREHACTCDENRDRNEREKRDARPTHVARRFRALRLFSRRRSPLGVKNSCRRASARI